ncbi:IS1595 family transposase [Povalibacter sp.]|uniref:IS1595 family transposase n=1 Tax=Povalibacter sp. TaxID=1962978 RepID=UPI002F3F2D34
MLTAPHFQDENKAREYLEAIRWPDSPVCPHCGVIGNHYRLEGEAHRPGLLKCKDCRKQFSVTVGTVFERSKIPLSKWLMAAYLLCSSKKGMSSHQLHRTLGVTYKTAWFLTQRIREAMREENGGLMGSGGGVVEADETFGNERKPRRQGKKGRGYQHKTKVLTLVERGGKARSFHVPNVNAATLAPILREQISADAKLMTDESSAYTLVGREFASHGFTSHGIGEYVRGDIHSNTVEGYFSIFKRGLMGTYHHISEAHLKRYLCEFDFRYNHRTALGVDDAARTVAALKGISGKRLTYKRSDQA